MDHQTLLDALVNDTTAYSDSNARQQAFRTSLAEHPTLDLSAVETAAVTEFDKLHAQDDAAPGALEKLRRLVDVIHAVRAEKKAHTTAPASGQTSAPAAAAPAGGSAPAAPASTAAPTAQAPQEATGMDNATARPGTEVVAASATTTVIKPADVKMPWESMPFDIKPSAASYVITAAAGAPGVEAGETFDDFGKLAKLLSGKFEALSRGLSEPSQMMLASARPEDWSNAYSNISRSGIASLGFSRDHDFVMAHPHDWQTIERACNEARLPGGTLTPTPASLTAAPGTPGWCAPSEVRYDFCPPAVLDGIVDVPTVIATRGTLTYPMMPDFGALYADPNAGFCFPAAEMDNPARADKPCLLVPCAETQTCTLDPCGICLQSSILIERAYPELIQYFMANALVAWGYRMNCRDLAQMIAQSRRVPTHPNTAVPPAPNNAPPLGPQTGPGATASILEVIEYYATWLRYRYRLGRNASVEAILPDWVKGVMRADLSKRMGVDLLAVTDAMIENWLTLRKVRVQFVLGLDEAFCDTGTTTPPSQINPAASLKFGGDALAVGTPAGGGGVPAAAPPALWPETVSFLMYPAGTFFRARMNLVNIEGGLVDSALLKRNERLLLFIEEASVICRRCYESLYITVEICASGQTGAGSTTHPACAFPTP